MTVYELYSMNRAIEKGEPNVALAILGTVEEEKHLTGMDYARNIIAAAIDIFGAKIEKEG